MIFIAIADVDKCIVAGNIYAQTPSIAQCQYLSTIEQVKLKCTESINAWFINVQSYDIMMGLFSYSRLYLISEGMMVSFFNIDERKLIKTVEKYIVFNHTIRNKLCGNKSTLLCQKLVFFTIWHIWFICNRKNYNRYIEKQSTCIPTYDCYHSNKHQKVKGWVGPLNVKARLCSVNLRKRLFIICFNLDRNRQDHVYEKQEHSSTSHE